MFFQQHAIPQSSLLCKPYIKLLATFSYWQNFTIPFVSFTCSIWNPPQYRKKKKRIKNLPWPMTPRLTFTSLKKPTTNKQNSSKMTKLGFININDIKLFLHLHLLLLDFFPFFLPTLFFSCIFHHLVLFINSVFWNKQIAWISALNF